MSAGAVILIILAVCLLLAVAAHLALSRTHTPGLPGQPPPRHHCTACAHRGQLISFEDHADLIDHYRVMHHVPFR